MKSGLLFFRLFLLLFLFLHFPWVQSRCGVLTDKDSTGTIRVSPDDILILDKSITIEIIASEHFIRQTYSFLQSPIFTKSELRKYGLLLPDITISFSKKITYRILSSKGAEQITEVTLPELMDPVYFSHAAKDDKTDYSLGTIDLKYFKGKVVTGKGEKKELRYHENIERIKIAEPDMLKSYVNKVEKYQFLLQPFQPGDEVTIEYKYDVSYYDNYDKISSIRIFFNDKMFIRNFQLSVISSSNIDIDVYNMNGAEPDRQIGINDKKVLYHWKRSDLPGCIDEAGSRPYLSLQGAIIDILPYDLPNSGDTIATAEGLTDTANDVRVPEYTYHFMVEKELFARRRRMETKSKYLKRLQNIKNIIQTKTEDITNDSSGLLKLLRIQTLFAESKCGTAMGGSREEKYGNAFKAPESSLSEVNVYDLYAAFQELYPLNMETYYMLDNRVGDISLGFYPSFDEFDHIFVFVFNKNEIHFVYPKSNGFGYYLDEIPFYFENSKVRFYPYYSFWNMDSTQKYVTYYGFVTPGSTVNDNYRRNNIMAEINTGLLSADFKAKIILSGQYSTLVRGAYLCGYSDETVNPLYGKKVWELNREVEDVEYDVGPTANKFPFKTVVSATYHFNNLMERKNDTIALNLKNWFNHIRYENFDTSFRQLDFYPDFCGKDTYVYYIRFDKNIRLAGGMEKTEIKNDFGKLIIETEQVQPDAVRITSYFETDATVVPADRIGSVKEIYDQIDAMNNSRLLFVIE